MGTKRYELTEGRRPHRERLEINQGYSIVRATKEGKRGEDSPSHHSHRFMLPSETEYSAISLVAHDTRI